MASFVRPFRFEWTHPALWDKAWRESRMRFIAGGAVFTFYCVTFVRGARYSFPPSFDPVMTYSEFVWRGIYGGIDVALFVLLALLLGLGGVQRERLLGTAAFTLALPVSRSSLLMVRAVVAVLQVATLALIPVLVVPWLSPHYAEQAYPAGQAVQFALLFAVVGIVWVAVGLLWSAILSGEHTTILACVLTPTLYAVAIKAPILREVPLLNLFNVMNGSRLPYLDPSTSYLVALPWMTLFVLAMTAAGGIAVAARITDRQDFS